MYQHYNYGIILIQKGATVHPLTFREEPDRIKKMWEDAEKAKKALYRTEKKGAKAPRVAGSHSQRDMAGRQSSPNKAGAEDDEEMQDAESEEQPKETFAKHTYKRHQNMFQAGRTHMQYYDEEDYDEEEDEESEDEDDLHQENIFNQ